MKSWQDTRKRHFLPHGGSLNDLTPLICQRVFAEISLVSTTGKKAEPEPRWVYSQYNLTAYNNLEQALNARPGFYCENKCPFQYKVRSL